MIIASSQVADLLGLPNDRLPAEFVAKLSVYVANLDTVNYCAIAVAGAALAVWLLALPVATIDSRFDELPNTLPMPQRPAGAPAGHPDHRIPAVPGSACGQ